MAIFFSLTPASSFAESSASVDVTVRQVFTVFGTDAKPDTGVNYSFNAIGDAPSPTGASEGVYDFKLDGNEKKTIHLSYVHAGVFEYTLSCSGSGGRGYTYDSEKYTIKVFVKNTEDGGLAAEVYADKSDGNKADLERDENGNYCVVYKHHYSPEKYKLLVDPPVKKAVKGKDAPKDDIFTFCLQAETKGAPMPDGSSDGIKTLQLKAGEEDDFGVWAYEEAGEYSYKVYEVDEGKEGYKYDKTIYAFTDKVTDKDGVLVHSRTYYDKDGNAIPSHQDAFSFDFENEYKSSSHGIGTFVKTGDTTQIVLWIVVALLALSAIVFLFVRARKGRSERKGA